MTDHTIPEGRAELRRLAGEATPGTWHAVGFHCQQDPDQIEAMGALDAVAYDIDNPGDTRWIAAACNTLPALLDDYERALARVAESDCWISVQQRVPKEHEWVLVADIYSGLQRGVCWGIDCDEDDVTHWRPLLEMPKETADA